jgi:hypothetical protein
MKDTLRHAPIRLVLVPIVLALNCVTGPDALAAEAERCSVQGEQTLTAPTLPSKTLATVSKERSVTVESAPALSTSAGFGAATPIARSRVRSHDAFAHARATLSPQSPRPPPRTI